MGGRGERESGTKEKLEHKALIVAKRNRPRNNNNNRIRTNNGSINNSTVNQVKKNTTPKICENTEKSKKTPVSGD